MKNMYIGNNKSKNNNLMITDFGNYLYLLLREKEICVNNIIRSLLVESLLLKKELISQFCCVPYTISYYRPKILKSSSVLLTLMIVIKMTLSDNQ